MSLTRAQTIEAARQLLASNGIVFDELGMLDSSESELPDGMTMADFREHARAVLSGPKRSKYGTGFNFLADGWRIREEELPVALEEMANAEVPLPACHPDYPLIVDDKGRRYLQMWAGYGELEATAVLRSRLEIAIKWKRAATMTEAERRKPGRAESGLRPDNRWTGDGAAETLISAARWMYALLRADGKLPPLLDPTDGVTIPGRGDPGRREMTDDELIEVLTTIIHHGPDPDLDRILLRYHLWTGFRDIAGINQRIDGFDRDKQTITAITKYGKAHTVPAPLSLIDDCLALAAARGSTEPDDPAFRTKNVRRGGNGELTPLHKGHYEDLNVAVQANLDWARDEGWTIYWCRHHAKARIQSVAGPAAALAMLGHNEKLAIERSGKATFGQLAWAVSVMTGHPHPAAQPPATPPTATVTPT